MSTLRVFFAAVLMTLSLSPAQASEPTTAHHADQAPLLSGAVWQIDAQALQQYTDEDLAARVQEMHGLGMRVLMIRSMAAPSTEDGQAGYLAYISNTAYPLHPAFKDRKPFSAIFRAADKHDMRVYLGGLALPQPIEQDYRANVDQWSSPRANQYRRELIERYAGYQSFAGYHIPNAPDPYTLIANRCDPDHLLTATGEVTQAIKSTKPDLRIVAPIGLYQRPTGQGGFIYSSAQDLQLFWRPWVQTLQDVDTWMVIDGLGSGLSTPEHTAMAQRWARDLAHGLGKSYWTLVENTHATKSSGGQATDTPYSLGELVRSLSTATRFADQTIASDYLNAMGGQSTNAAAARLHEAYTQYVNAFQTAQD